MDVKLRLNHFQDMKEKDVEILDQIQKLQRKRVKITTNTLRPVYDRKDQSKIRSLDGLKIIYKMEEGCLLLIGNLGCTFRDGFKGEFFVKRVVKEPNSDFDSITAVTAIIDFSDPLDAIDNDDLYDVLEKLKDNPKLVYNIGQFDEFMELFEFYRKLSNELSNNISYKIKKIYPTYCFLPIGNKELNLEFKEEVYDNQNIIIGYKFDKYQFDILSNDTKDCVKFLIDIEIDNDGEIGKKIKSIGLNNLYLSNIEQVSDRDVSSLVQLQVYNVVKTKDKIIISGELKDDDDDLDYRFLNLYDMGQKIKIESIDNSLKLINQGASGAASELLRYLIGDDPMPSYGEEYDSKKENYMFGLNDLQRKAFLMCTDGSPVSLIKGPPGTGKTHVINAIVQYITKELGEKVIISSQTHVAIDNVLDKLIANYDAIIPNRITNRRNKYSDSEIDRTLFNTWGRNFGSHNYRATNRELADRVIDCMKNFNGEQRLTYSEETGKNDYMVIGATTTTSAIAGKKGLEVLKGYNWLIIDEVSKCPITEVLRYLPYVEKIIMVGDDFQLSPLLEFTKEDVMNLPSYNEDLFEKLKNMYESSVFEKTLKKAKECNRVVQLNENYRSVKDVLHLYNVFYDNNLIEKRSTIKKDKVVINSHILENQYDTFFVEVLNGKEDVDGTSRYNVEELHATKDILEELIKTTENIQNVTVAAIFPYAAQISKFKKDFKDLINEAKSKFKSFEIDTVDAFQGREADIVLCNTVVTDSSRRNFLSDFRRINVSMSRAKDKIIIFGNSITLSKIDMSVGDGPSRKFFKDIIQYIVNNGKKIKYDGGIKDEITSKSTIKFADF